MECSLFNMTRCVRLSIAGTYNLVARNAQKVLYDQEIKKSNLYHTLGITPKRVTSGGVHLRAWGIQLQRNVAEAASRWQYCIRYDRPGIEPQTFRTDSVALNN